MPRVIEQWVGPQTDITGEDFYALSGGNVYVGSYGYLDVHVLADLQRNNPAHWNEQFKNTTPFQAEWKPRPGPLNFVSGLIKDRLESGITEPLLVLNAGGGLGEFTADLAKSGADVVHVDFSQTANRVAQANVRNAQVEENVQIVNAENRAFLKDFIDRGQKADVIFFYGGLVENTPLEQDVEETLSLAVEALVPGGYIWVVCLEQPFLDGTGDDHVTDILGEYPGRPGLVREIFESMPNIYLVREERGDRPDNHPLKPGGPSEAHMHVVYRGLYVKIVDGEDFVAPEFSFK